MNEISTILKVIQELIPELAEYFNLNEQELTEFVTKYLEDSEIIQALLPTISKPNFEGAEDNSK